MDRSRPYRRVLFIILGSICLVLAYIGIIMPGIPGIPFLLLTSYFFINSSDRIHDWLLRQKITGRLLRTIDRKKNSRGYKLFVVSQLWVSIIVAEILLIHNTTTSIIVITAGILVSFLTYKLMSTDQ